MGESRRILLLFIFQLFLGISATNAFSGEEALKRYEYISPLPFSFCHNPETAIIVRFGERIDIFSVRNELFEVTGDISGKHPGKFTISQDLFTLIFTPDQIFLLDEKVTVNLLEGIKTHFGRLLPAFDFWFTIRQKTDLDLNPVFQGDITKQDKLQGKPAYNERVKGTVLSYIDFNFPEITISDNPTKGNILTTLVNNSSNYLYVFDNNAIPVFARIMPHPISNLKSHNAGKITYYDTFIKSFVALDSTLTVVDTFAMKNGYRTDSHEILLLKNGHVFMFSYDPQIVDMSKIVTGGNPVATVTGLVIQELDVNKNLIFQWRSWDYFNITDTYSDLLSSVVNYVHGNSLDANTDTTLIISSRNMNEVTKINRLTGDIIWRLGGKNNEFTFENDPRRFAGQHSAIIQKNGNLTLFDNGLDMNPLYSRGIEYEIDEKNRRVKLVNQYRHSPDVYANVSGNLQRLENGNTFIFFGPAIDHSEQFICEFDQTGNTIFEARFDITFYPTYRAYRSFWEPKIFSLSIDTLIVENIIQNSEVNRTIQIRNNSSRKISITSAYHKNLGFYVKDLPVAIEAGAESSFSIVFPSYTPGNISDNIIFCMETDSTIITRKLFVSIDNSLDTGIEDEFQNNYIVSPNPGKGEFNVEISRPGRFLLKLFDLSGNIIWEACGDGTESYNFDLGNRPDGLYLLSLNELDTGKKFTVKLIKQK